MFTTEQELKNLQKLAEGGDAEACFKWGLTLYEGDEVSQDSKQAFTYFCRAEEAGNPLAAYYKGLCLYYGQGTEASDHKAHALFEKAAEDGVTEAEKALETLPFYEHDLTVRALAGDDEACCILGASFHFAEKFYDRNLSVDEAYKRAVRWYEIAAEHGYPRALRQLGNIYHYGWGVGCNEEKSKEYYKRAESAEKAAGEAGTSAKPADVNGAEAQMKLALKFREEARQAELQVRRGNEVEKNTAEAKDKHKKSFDCIERAVEGEYVLARYDLADFYYRGFIVEQDYAKALELLLPVARCTHGNRLNIWRGASAARKIGDMYSGGLGVKRDEKKAFNWYLSAASRDSMVACTKVGNAYFYGVGTEQNYEAAAFWFEQAVFDYDEQMFYDSDKGYDYGANVGLGDCYRLGLGVKKDEEEAFRLYDDVSKYTNDCPAADERVARCYYFGIGVQRDEEQARGYWENAAKYGDEDAKAALKKYFPEE